MKQCIYLVGNRVIRPEQLKVEARSQCPKQGLQDYCKFVPNFPIIAETLFERIGRIKLSRLPYC